MNICSLLLVSLLTFFASNTTYTKEGKASFYADRFHGHRTTSGEKYDKTQLTAAHVSLPFNTKVLVTNVKNGRSVLVRINDRMASKRQTIIDLSKAAADKIDMVREGVASVKLEVIDNTRDAQQEPPLIVSEKAPLKNN